MITEIPQGGVFKPRHLHCIPHPHPCSLIDWLALKVGIPYQQIHLICLEFFTTKLLRQLENFCLRNLINPLHNFLLGDIHIKLIMPTNFIVYHKVSCLFFKMNSWTKLNCFENYDPSLQNALTHWGRDKMAAISQTTISKSFSWMKIYEFSLKFHWSLFLGAQITIFHHWFR